MLGVCLCLGCDGVDGVGVVGVVGGVCDGVDGELVGTWNRNLEEWGGVMLV